MVQETFPGVYIEGLPSGVRTITAAATSVTAFVGYTSRGPDHAAKRIFSFAEFVRIFGGLDPDSELSYLVHHFFTNGGAEAVIVRVPKHDAKAASVTLLDGDSGSPKEALRVTACGKGTWGNALVVEVDYDGLDDDKTFHLTVTDLGSGLVEKFANVTMDSGKSNYVVNVVNDVDGGSEQITVEVPDSSAARPVQTGTVGSKTDTTSLADAEGRSTKPYGSKFSGDHPSGLADKDHRIVLAEGEDGRELPKTKDLIGLESAFTGIYALETVELFNLLSIPDATRADVDNPSRLDSAVDPNAIYSAAMSFCQRRRAFLIVDPPPSVNDVESATKWKSELLGVSGVNGAAFFPRVRVADPLHDGQLRTFAPSGVLAGVLARTDATRGVWKAAAGIEASLTGVQGLVYQLTDAENGALNEIGLNCLRYFPVHGHVAWGSRTLAGADAEDREWKYIPVRRTTLFLEESLFRGTQWVVFEPNDESLWAQIRLKIGAFMHGLFLQCAFQGKTPREAYFVKCDKETMTQDDINQGIVNMLVGFAPLKPAEFVVIKIQQIAGGIQA